MLCKIFFNLEEKMQTFIKNFKLYERAETLYIDCYVSLSLSTALKKQNTLLSEEQIHNLRLKESGFKRLRFSSKLQDTSKTRHFLQTHSKELILRYMQEGNANFKKIFAEFSVDKTQTLAFFVDFLLKQSSELKPTTKNSYKNSAADIMAFFKNRPITEITSSDILAFYHFLEARMQPNSIRVIMTFFRRACELAVQSGIIAHNPVFFKKFANPLQKTQRNVPFNDEEFYALLNTNGDLGLYLKIALLTGMRKGEILALQYKDFDFANNSINIYKAVCSVSGHLISPKTRSSVRKIDMLALLKKHLLKESEGKHPERFLFTLRKGELIRSFNLSPLGKAYKKRLCELDIPYRTIYSTRHTFASIMLSKNEPLVWVSSMLGHQNSRMTLDKYAQYIPKPNTRHAQFLEGVSI